MRRLLASLVPVLAVSLGGSLALTAPADAHPRHHRLSWQERDTPSTESLRGLDAVDRRTAWVAGDDGGVWRTTDGGRSWSDVAPAGSEGLAFRDVEAFSARTAVVMAIGEADASRIYRTVDGGRTWTTTFVNDEPTAFYDCLDFFPGGRRGLAMSDPVDGRFRILATRDGGRHWKVVPSDGMPAAVDGEFGFAASGTCLETAGRHDVYLGSGGAVSRIFHSRDGGRHWTVTDAPIPAAPGGGVSSLAFRGPRVGVAAGGDFDNPDVAPDSAAFTRDGRTWTGSDPGGYRSGVDWVPGSRRTLVAVGLNGSDVSRDGGRTWSTFSDTGFHAVVCVRDRHTCWASGSDGRVARLSAR